MTEHTAENDAWLAGVRRQAEYEIERFPNDDWPPIVLALLAILDDRTRPQVNESEPLTLAEASEIVGDDIAYWLDNPFFGRESLAQKVCWWIAQSRVPSPGSGRICGQVTDWPGQPCGLFGGHPGGHLPQISPQIPEASA